MWTHIHPVARRADVSHWVPRSPQAEEEEQEEAHYDYDIYLPGLAAPCLALGSKVASSNKVGLSASFPTPPVRLFHWALTHSLFAILSAGRRFDSEVYQTAAAAASNSTSNPTAAPHLLTLPTSPHHFSTPADADADAALAAAQNATPFSPSHKVPPLCLCLYQDPPHHNPDLRSFSASPAATDHAHSHATLNSLRRTRKLCAAAARRFVQNVNKHHGVIPVSVRGNPAANLDHQPPLSLTLGYIPPPHLPSTMTDQYLQEQHALTIARTVQRERQLAQARLDSDHGDSWVMITQTGDINPLPHEHIRHRSNAKISLELSVPKALQQGRTPFARKSDNGTAYITTQRVIYIPAKPTAEFKSFHAPILNCADSYVGSPFFGAWFWSATVVPVSGGGVPADIPRVEVKMSFKEGGHSEFRQRFEELKERLEHVRRLQQETGQTVNIPDEPLPAYEATEGGGAAPSSLAPQQQQQEEAAGRPASPGGQNANRRPDEPPPDYDEAQAQTLSMRLEDHVREESDRA
ncbi:WW-domain ligand protein [Colletotrichum melonis]|uniref:WW-domain ligand protein n=1 Tax=Colletotrichum melonis TaxID=1209925 RepID=A0AAI9UWC2_9PEZI|nr:WW-domain ligand protein [Colletotrichum melonis]